MKTKSSSLINVKRTIRKLDEEIRVKGIVREIDKYS